MDQDRGNDPSRETTQELQRKKSTIRIDQGPQDQHLQKRQNTRDGSRGPSPTTSPTWASVNSHLESYHYSPKGLHFIPTPHKKYPAKPLQGILQFDRKLRLKYYFNRDTLNEFTKSTELTEEKTLYTITSYSQALDGPHPQDKTFS